MKKKRVFKFVSVLICMSLIVSFWLIPGLASSEEEVIKLKVQTVFSLEGQDSLSALNTMKRIEEVSGGRIKLTPLLAPGTIVAAAEVLDAVETGVLDIAFTWPGYWVGKNSAFTLFASVTGGPYGMSNVDFWGWMIFGGGKELHQELYKKIGYQNIVPLTVKLEVGEAMGWFTKQLKSIEECKGIKVRAAGLGTVGYKEAGMSVTMVPGPEIVSCLERGIIDAAEYGDLRAEYAMGFPRFAKYMHVPGMHQPTGFLGFLVNRRAWEKLPPDLQKIFEACCNEMVFYNILEEYRDQAEFMKKFEEEEGVTIVEVPNDILKAFLVGWDKFVEEEIAKNPNFAEIYNSQKAYAEKVVPYEKKFLPDYSFLADYYWPEK